MRRFHLTPLLPVLIASALHAQTTVTADPDHIDLDLKEVSVALPINHWDMLDGKPDSKIMPCRNVAFIPDAAGHKVVLTGPPADVRNTVDSLRFFDRDNANLTTRTIKLQHVNPAAAARLLNDLFAPRNGYAVGDIQIFSIPAADEKSILVSGWKPGLERVASLLEKLDVAPPATQDSAADPRKMPFQFEDASVDDIFKSMEKQFGMIILRSDHPITTKITIKVPDPVTQDQSIKLVNAFLTQIGYIAYQSQMMGPDNRIILQIFPATFNRGRIPVNFGSDPAKVPTSDNLITQIIPLAHAKAADIKKELESLASPDADIAVNEKSNSIVITDTAAKIHSFLVKLPAIDK